MNYIDIKNTRDFNIYSISVCFFDVGSFWLSTRMCWVILHKSVYALLTFARRFVDKHFSTSLY